MLYRCVPHNVATTLWKLRDIYNVNTTSFYNVMSTLKCNVALYVVTTLLVRLFHNVLKKTFLQRCTTLYVRCMFAGVSPIQKGENIYIFYCSYLEIVVKSIGISLYPS